MRTIIEFAITKRCLSIDYRYACMSFIKNILAKHYPKKLDELYGSNVMKQFTFSLFVPKAKIDNKTIQCGEDKIFLEISSADEAFIYMLYNGALRERGKAYPFPDELFVVVKNVKIAKIPQITASTVKIKMKSPLLVRKHISSSNIDEYLTPQDGEFDDIFQLNTNNLLSAINKSPEQVKLTPINCKNTAVLLKGKYFKCNYGIFLLSGTPELLTLLSNTGIGSRRSQGFGMFELEG